MQSNHDQIIEFMGTLSPTERQEFIKQLDEDEINLILYDWDLWSRPSQRIPRDKFYVWLILAGRGWGKTKTGAETTRQVVERGAKELILVGPTPGDCIDIMLYGPSGILACSPPWNKPEYTKNSKLLTWPNGARGYVRSGAVADDCRGLNADYVWLDEPASYMYLQDVYDNATLALRNKNSKDSFMLVTGTPKPFKFFRTLMQSQMTHLTRGSTFENVDNLSTMFIENIKEKYEGTRTGRQELYAEILDDNPNALWKRDDIDNSRFTMTQYKATKITRICVSIDPSVSDNEDSDKTGIVVVGVDDHGHGYVLDDVTTSGNPYEWGRAAVQAYYDWEADLIVYEKNQGGLLVESNIKTLDNNIKCVGVTAKRSGQVRAEPISSLYEQHKIHHVGNFNALEANMCEWVPSEHCPDNVSALVWGLTELILNGKKVYKPAGAVGISKTSIGSGRERYRSI